MQSELEILTIEAEKEHKLFQEEYNVQQIDVVERTRLYNKIVSITKQIDELYVELRITEKQHYKVITEYDYIPNSIISDIETKNDFKTCKRIFSVFRKKYANLIKLCNYRKNKSDIIDIEHINSFVINHNIWHRIYQQSIIWRNKTVDNKATDNKNVDNETTDIKTVGL